ncbi:MAG: hypothetical protein JOZ78_07980 [Chroococcidiopsidaceae cyanobacterium CP_BM_ER_R8_30]|nr:hypothetical protein [Chroococcidiopsidaceae cyanobacterium CP_BM_ER_R8_30]
MRGRNGTSAPEPEQETDRARASAQPLVHLIKSETARKAGSINFVAGEPV